MRVTSTTAHYERKLNTGPYSSVTLGTWITIESYEGDDPVELLDVGMTLCREAVKKAAVPFVKNAEHVTDPELVERLTKLGMGTALPPVTVSETIDGLPVVDVNDM